MNNPQHRQITASDFMTLFYLLRGGREREKKEAHNVFTVHRFAKRELLSKLQQQRVVVPLRAASGALGPVGAAAAADGSAAS